MKSKKSNYIRIMFYLTSITFSVLFFSFAQIDKVFNHKQKTLIVFDYSMLSDEEIKEFPNITIVHNLELNKYKITKYPTYILTKTETEEMLIISNKLEDIKDYLKIQD